MVPCLPRLVYQTLYFLSLKLMIIIPPSVSYHTLFLSLNSPVRFLSQRKPVECSPRCSDKIEGSLARDRAWTTAWPWTWWSKCCLHENVVSLSSLNSKWTSRESPIIHGWNSYHQIRGNPILGNGAPQLSFCHQTFVTSLQKFKLILILLYWDSETFNPNCWRSHFSLPLRLPLTTGSAKWVSLVVIFHP